MKSDYFKAKFYVSLKDEIDMLKRIHVCDNQHWYHPVGWGPSYCNELCKLQYLLIKRLESVEITINVPVKKEEGLKDLVMMCGCIRAKDGWGALKKICDECRLTASYIPPESDNN